MILDILEFKVENETKIMQNCFKKLVSDLWNIGLFVLKTTFRTSAKNKQKIYKPWILEKSRIRETPTLSTAAESGTNTILERLCDLSL